MKCMNLDQSDLLDSFPNPELWFIYIKHINGSHSLKALSLYNVRVLKGMASNPVSLATGKLKSHLFFKTPIGFVPNLT